ncbi:MAG: hypothetical protein NTV21_12910 [Planctomycetota bacterium]|nr:hypothetical protein [Planctomycetota bacterium]
MNGLILAGILLSQGAPGRWRQAEIEVRGPLQALDVVVPGRARTRLVLDIAEGEVRTLVVPVVAPQDAGELELHEQPELAGEARWFGWSREGLNEVEAEWEQLPRALRERPSVSPAEETPGRGPQPVALAFAAAATLVVLSLRRKPLLALSVSAAASVGWCVFALSNATVPQRELRVLEGDGASGRWIVVDSGWEVLHANADLPLKLEVEPAAASVEAEAQVGAAGLKGLRLEAHRARLVRVEALDPGPRSVSNVENRWGDFEEAWTRTPDGRWQRHGAWPVGAPLPTGEPGDPPGAFNPALPMGQAVLIGRLAPGSFAGADSGDFSALSGAGTAPERPLWLRWIGTWQGEERVPR